jgi:hypothetical protein
LQRRGLKEKIEIGNTTILFGNEKKGKLPHQPPRPAVGGAPLLEKEGIYVL